MISVRVGTIHDNASLMIINTLSPSGALFEGNKITILYYVYGKRAERELVSGKGVGIRRWH